MFVLGVLAQGMRAVSIYFLARGMDLDIGFATLLVLCPVLFLVTSCPLSLNGIGLREATFVVVLGGAGVAREDAFALGLAFFAVGVLSSAARRPGAAEAGDCRPPRQDWRVESSNVNLHAPSRARSGDALRGRGSGALERSRPLARAAAQNLAHNRRRARPCAGRES